jgi:hypothetical protein
MERPLQGLKVIATIPPHFWFGGVDFDFASEMAEELRTLGATVFELDTAGFFIRNELYIESAIQSLRSFRADVAISLPNAGYAILCATLQGENVFKDVLQIPTLMLWDHGLLQFPKRILDPLPPSPAESSQGAIRRMRKALDHPLYIHYSPDRGHIAELDRLGVIDSAKVRYFLQPAYPNFVRQGYRGRSSHGFNTRLAFAGNVYMQASRDLPFRGDKVLDEIETRVLKAKREQTTVCLWDLILAEIKALDKPSRRRLRLEPDSTFFWRFLYDEIEVTGNTDARLAILTGLKRECDFFGNFIESGTDRAIRDQYGIRFRKPLDYFTELPLLFTNSDLIVDVVNLGYNTGTSPKIMGCLACGGLVLFDYKEDFYQGMGEVANQVMYRSVEQLNSMVDEYLGNPRKRQDISRYLQHRACTDFSFSTLCKRMFVEEAAWRVKSVASAGG